MIRFKSFFWCFVCLSIVFVFAALIHQQTMSPLIRYQDRFNSVLPVSNTYLMDKQSNHLSVPYPDVRLIRLEQPNRNVSLFDVLKLKDCELKQHIIEHNGSMGKVADGFGQLNYDFQFIQSAPACLATLQDEITKKNSSEATAKLVAIVLEATEQKKNTYWSSYWNATFASNEFRRYVSQANIKASTQLNVQKLSALKSIVTAVVDKQLFAPPPIELLQHWFFSQDLGKWLAYQRVTINHLNVMSERLEGHWSPARLCPQGKPTRRARELLQVVKGNLVAKLQPYWVEVRRFGDAWISVSEPLLIDPHGHISPEFSHWLAYTHGLHGDFIGAIREHVKGLSATFSACGLSLGGEPIADL